MSEQVTRKVKTRRNQNAEVHEQVYTFDFEDVTREELIGMALSKLVIDYQAKARKCKTDKEMQEKFGNLAINVREMLDAVPQRKTKEEKAVDLLVDLGHSREEAEAIIYG